MPEHRAPTVLITTSSFDLSNPLIGEIEAAGWTVVNNPLGRRLTEEEVSRILTETGAEAMVAGVEPLTAAVFAANPRLRIISRCGIGMDSVDLAAAAAGGISVANTPEAPVAATAELTVALMLTLLRRVAEADRTVRAGSWKPLMGTSLADQVVGIVGLGRVGSRVATLVSAFGAAVEYFDPQVTEATYVRRGSISDLAASADVLTLHVPITDETRGIVDGSVIGAMAPTAYLVNASRGGLVDEAALYDALVAERLAGAALDVFEAEPYDGPLRDLPNVVVTCHMGSYARQNRAVMETDALRNLLRAIGARPTAQ